MEEVVVDFVFKSLQSLELGPVLQGDGGITFHAFEAALGNLRRFQYVQGGRAGADGGR